MVGVLALSMGANLLLFQVVDQVLLRPPPGISQPRQLIRFHTERLSPTIGLVASNTLSFPDFQALAADSSVLADVAGYFKTNVEVGFGATRHRAKAAVVSESYFRTLGVGLRQTPRHDGIVVSRSFARSLSPDINTLPGQAIAVSGSIYSISEVAPQDFVGTDFERVDLWLPLDAMAGIVIGGDWRLNRASSFLSVIGRLRPGVTLQASQAALEHYLRPAAGSPLGTDRSPKLMADYYRRAQGDMYRRVVRVSAVLAGVALLLLCAGIANVATLLVSRLQRGKHDLAVRVALGASSRHLVRHLAVDAVLVASSSALAAILLVFYGAKAVAYWLVPGFSWGDQVLSPEFVVTALGILLLCGTALVWAPWLGTRRPSITRLLSAAPATTSPSHHSARSVLLAVQSGALVLLLMGAAVFVQTLVQLNGETVGFDAEHTLVIDFGFESESTAPITLQRLRDLQARLRFLPDVVDVGLGSDVPLRRSTATSMRVPGRGPAPQLPTGGPYVLAIDDHFLATLDAPVIRGRGFTEQDLMGSQQRVLINESLMKQVWKGANPIGDCIIVMRDTSCREVIGVVRDIKRELILEAPTMVYFVPLHQGGDIAPPNAVFVRTRQSPAALWARLPLVLRSAGFETARVQIDILATLITPQVTAWRLAAIVFMAYGLIAFGIAALGYFGAVSADLASRKRELAIRLALGASTGRIANVLAKGIGRDAALGACIGIVGFWIAWPVISPLMVKVTIADLIRYSGAAAACSIALTFIFVGSAVYRMARAHIVAELKTA